MVGNDLPEAASTHLLLMRSLLALIFTVGSITAVAMDVLLGKMLAGQTTKGYSCAKREAMRQTETKEKKGFLLLTFERKAIKPPIARDN